MIKDDLRRLLFVLGKEHCLDVMINLYKNEWQTASSVAKDLNLHVATAVKYLSELHELGLVNRRIKRGRTRDAFEYSLRTQNIRIEIEIETLIENKSKPDGKPLVLFGILFILLAKSKKVIGNSMDTIFETGFERLVNGEKNIVLDSLMFDGDMEDAADEFLRNLNGSALTEERCEEVVNALSALIEIIIAHYESRFGHHSTESLVDVTMNKVIGIIGAGKIESGDMLSSLPYDYFGKWESEILPQELREPISQEAQDN
jgi:predicted transcriptional regulator